MKNVTLVAAIWRAGLGLYTTQDVKYYEACAAQARVLCKACGDDPDAEVFALPVKEMNVTIEASASTTESYGAVLREIREIQKGEIQ